MPRDSEQAGMTDEQDSGSRPANSLERILAVLGVFSERRLEWTPEELMEELGYTRPTLYRYLKTLREAGLVTSLPNAGFTLGPRVVELDYFVRRSDPLIAAATSHLTALAELFECTSLVARWYGDSILCIDSEHSTAIQISSYERGRPMSLGRGAIPRSIVAFLPRQRQLAVVRKHFDDMRSVGLGDDVEAIVSSLRRVRSEGYAVGYGEVTPGVVGVAAPIFDGGRSPIASLCVTIAGHHVRAGTVEHIAAEIRTRAATIGEALQTGQSPAL